MIATQLFTEVQSALISATPDQIITADLFQFDFNITYCAERVLAASAPGLDEAQRWAVAREISEQHRSGEHVIETVRRWLPEDWKQTIKRDSKGKMLTSPSNAYALLKFHPEVRGTLRFNLFTKQVEAHGGPFAGRSNRDIDTIVTAVQDWIYDKEGCAISFADLGRRVVLVAIENSFDPIQDYLHRLTWDQTERISAGGGWLCRYAGVLPTPYGYVREIGKRWLLAAVSRAVEPGSKTDVVLIAEGLQGTKKSSMFEALGGPFYADAAIALGDKDSKMLASSAWITELPDMASFKRSEQNALKAFFATRNDTMRVPFGRSVMAFPRRCVFVATTNDNEYLTDPTGNRRYWPVECTEVDLSALIADRDQLWAEAMHIFRASESCAACAMSKDTVWGQRPRCAEHRWWLDRDMAAAAAAQTKTREDVDVWTPAVAAWVMNPVASDATGLSRNSKTIDITTASCLVYAIGKPLGQCSQSDKIRVGRILKQLGYEVQKKHAGPRVYTKAGSDLRPKIALV